MRIYNYFSKEFLVIIAILLIIFSLLQYYKTDQLRFALNELINDKNYSSADIIISQYAKKNNDYNIVIEKLEKFIKNNEETISYENSGEVVNKLFDSYILAQNFKKLRIWTDHVLEKNKDHEYALFIKKLFEISEIKAEFNNKQIGENTDINTIKIDRDIYQIDLLNSGLSSGEFSFTKYPKYYKKDLAHLIHFWQNILAKDYEKANEIIEEITINNQTLSYHKALAKMLAGDFEAAKSILDNFVDNHSRINIQNEAANLYFKLNKTEKAEELIEDFKENYENKSFWSKNTPLIATQNSDVIFKYILIDAFFNYVSLSNYVNDYESAIYLLSLSLILDENNEYVNYLSGEIMTKLQKFERANDFFEKITKDHLSYEEAKINIALNYYELGETKKTESILKDLYKETGNYLPLLNLANIYLESENYVDALKQAEIILNDLEDSETKKQYWRIFYLKGIASERLNKWPQAEKSFLKALELNPNHPSVLNYLAYSWIEKDMNLEKSMSMLRLALASEPRSGHIIDSYGWGLYKQQKYDEAVKYLEKASSLVPSEPEIIDHLGDVYWQLGRKREARYEWKKAYDLYEEDSDKRLIIRKKLLEGLEKD